MLSLSARELAGSIRAGSRCAAAAGQAAVGAARAASDLGAIWSLDEERVARDSGRLDEVRQHGGDPGELAGVALVVKDAFDVAGLPGGAGGPIQIGEHDAGVVTRCRRAGAVVIGKAAMHQLGWGMSGQCPGRPPCKNPRLPGRQPGGSSSGSAAAVAAGIVRVALGADTAGSVRLPAAWCGVVGYKPEQAALPRSGLAPLARPLDCVGYLAASVDDCLVLHETLAERVIPISPPDGGVRGLRVATDSSLLEGCTPDVVLGFESGLDVLRDAGAVVVEEPLPPHRVPLGMMYAAALAREWGKAVDANPELFGDDVRAGVAAGRVVAGREDELGEAWRRREHLRQSASLDADAFACPAAPIVAPPLDAPDDVATAGRLLRPFNVLDWPAMVVPVPGSLAPIGFQLAAPVANESALWSLARAVEVAF